MMTRVKKMGLAGAVGLGLCLGGPASAQLESNFDLVDAVSGLSDLFDFTIGSAGNQSPGSNEDVDCPGAVPGGDEDIFDFDLDGVPDYAQMALVVALYNQGDSQTVAAVNGMSNGLKTEPIPLAPGSFGPGGCDPEEVEGCLCLEISGQEACGENLRTLLLAVAGDLQTNTLPPVPELLLNPLLANELLGDLGLDCSADQAACLTLFNQAIDALTVWGVINNPANFEATVCLDEIVGLVVGLLTNTFNPGASNLSGLVNGSVVLEDGDTILDKWNEAIAAKTSAVDDPNFLAAVDTFVALVLAGGLGDGSPGNGGGGPSVPFPPAPPGSPVAAPLGLALLAAGLGAAALHRSRRRG